MANDTSSTPFLKTASFNQSGGALSVDVFFGQAQLCEYIVKLYDSEGKNSKFREEGNNIDNLPDTFILPGGAKVLNERVVSWALTIGAPVEGAGQLYFARVTITRYNSDTESD